MPDRLAWPLRLGPDGRLATVEQDSPEDVGQCLLAIGRTRPGDRWDEPEMGVTPQAFAEGRVDTDDVAEVLGRFEQRASVRAVVLTRPVQDALDRVVAEIDIEASIQRDPGQDPT